MSSLVRVFSVLLAGGLCALACGAATDTSSPSPIGASGSNPGKVMCDGTECDVSSGYFCCSRDGLSCMFGCPNTATYEMHCDESADCPEPTFKKCCLGGRTTLCQSECKDGPQVCKTQAECGGAGCSLKTCNGIKMQVCGAPAGCQ